MVKSKMVSDYSKSDSWKLFGIQNVFRIPMFGNQALTVLELFFSIVKCFVLSHNLITDPVEA